MKKPLVVIALTLLSGLLTAQAQEELDANAVKAAKELFTQMEMEKVMSASMEQALDPQLEQMRRFGISDQGMTDLKKEMLAFMREVMSWEIMEPELVRLYASNFTTTELNEMTAFYQTPTGKKALQLTPTLMAEGMKMGQQAVQARQAELQARIQPIIEREMSQKSAP